MNIIFGLFRLIFIILWTPIKLVLLLLGAIGQNAESWAKDAYNSREVQNRVGDIQDTFIDIREKIEQKTKPKQDTQSEKPAPGTFFVVRAVNNKATVIPIAIVEIRGALVKTTQPDLGYINESEIMYTEDEAKKVAANSSIEALCAKAKMCISPLLQNMWDNMPEGMRISV